MKRALTLLAALAALSIPASSRALAGTLRSSAGVCMPWAAAAAPPTGFDPVRASDADLACYGVPQRPKDPTLLQHWVRVWSGAHYVYPTSALNHPVGEGRPYQAYTGVNWAGYHARANQNTQWPYTQWYEADAETVVRGAATTTNSNCIGKRFGQWTGLGGDTSGSNLSQDGVEEKAGNPPSYRLWWQTSSNMDPVTITEVPVNPADIVDLTVHYNIGQASTTFTVNNTTTHLWTSFTKGAANPDQDIDFEVEEPDSLPYGPWVNFPHIPFSYTQIWGVWGSSGQYLLDKNLNQVNSITDQIIDASNNVVASPTGYGSEPYGFDVYANGSFTGC